MKKFGDILASSWKEYKENIKIYVLLMIIFLFIPSIIVFVFQINWEQYYLNIIINNPIIKTDNISMILSPFLDYRFLIFSIVSIISFFIGLISSSSLIYSSLYNKDSKDFKRTLKGGFRYYPRFLKLVLFSYAIIAIPLLLAIGLIFLTYKLDLILGIIFTLISIIFFIIYSIFMIYIAISWLFSSYIIIDENKKVIESIKQSFRIVKGHWWEIFGYILLFALICIAIYFILLTPNVIINLLYPEYSYDYLIKGLISINDYMKTFIIFGIINILLNFLVQLIIIPLGVLFIKNMYNDLKGNDKKKK